MESQTHRIKSKAMSPVFRFSLPKEQKRTECKAMVHCTVRLNDSKLDKDTCNFVQLSFNSTLMHAENYHDILLFYFLFFFLSGDCQTCNFSSISWHLFYTGKIALPAIL